MAILVDANTRVIVQGATGRWGSKQTRDMLDAGTNIVAGVTPGRGGSEVHGIPIYDTIREAASHHDFDASVIYVPAPRAKVAAIEAIENGLKLVVIITEGIPIHDGMAIKAMAERRGVWIVGPNTPGLIVPGQTSLGMYPPANTCPGPVGVISRSGTLSFEVIRLLTAAGLGQTICAGIGGDPVIGKGFLDYLRLLEADDATRLVVMVGEIGGQLEEEAASFITSMGKPVVVFIAGRHAPPDKTMGHAGAIILGKRGGAQAKIDALVKAGADVAETLDELVSLAVAALNDYASEETTK